MMNIHLHDVTELRISASENIYEGETCVPQYATKIFAITIEQGKVELILYSAEPLSAMPCDQIGRPIGVF